MGQYVNKADLDAFWAKIKADMTHSLAISGTDLKLTRELHEGNPLAPTSPRTIYDLGTISQSAGRTWLGLKAYAYTDLAESDIPTLSISKISGLQTALNNKLETSLKGVAGGLAELDANGVVPASQLPSFVDDVLEYSSASAFPSTGETGKIYVATDTNLTYRWSGTQYTEISQSLALGTTSSTAYRGDLGAIAYAHATDANRLTTAQDSGFYKFATTAEGHIKSVTAVVASDITSVLGNTAVARATGDANGNNIINTYATKATINALDYDDPNYASGKYVSKVTQTDGQISVTHASFVKPVVSITNGTTDGPTMTVQATGGTSDSKTIPSASASYSGVVTTDAQTFAGDKTFNGNINGMMGVSARGIANLGITSGGGTGDVTSIQFGNGSLISASDGLLAVPVGQGTSNGQINIGGQDVSVKGLGTFAYISSLAFADLTNKPTTLAGYGITDAKIANGAITLGSNTITPLTSHQTLYNLVINNSAGTAQITYKPGVSGTYALTLTKAMVGLSNVGDFLAVSTVASQGLTDTQKANARANIGAGTSSLVIGNTSTTAAAGDHTHTTSIGTSSGTNQLTLAFGTKYALTAGGTSYIFTMPSNPNTDRYVNTAAFAYDSTNDNIKMTLTRAGSDSATVVANIPKATTSATGLMSKADKTKLDGIDLAVSGSGDSQSFSISEGGDTVTVGRIGVDYINSLS